MPIVCVTFAHFAHILVSGNSPLDSFDKPQFANVVSQNPSSGPWVCTLLQVQYKSIPLLTL